MSYQLLIAFIIGFFLGAFTVGYLWSRDKRDDHTGYPLRIPTAHPVEPFMAGARFEAVSQTGKITHIYEYRNATPAQMVNIADHLASGNTVTVTFMDHLTGGRKYGEALRAELIDKSILRWRNPDAHKEGLIPTAKGTALFKQLANNPTLSRYIMHNDSLQNARRTHRVQSIE